MHCPVPTVMGNELVSLLITALIENEAFIVVELICYGSGNNYSFLPLACELLSSYEKEHVFML